MGIVERARELRKQIEAGSAILDDENALKYTELFPTWSGNSVSYQVGARVRYNDILYKVLSAHISQPLWTPEEAVSLFAEVLVSDDNTILEWKQPSSTNPYMTGDLVIYDGQTYKSVIDNNVWSPTAYPAGWQLI